MVFKPTVRSGLDVLKSGDKIRSATRFSTGHLADPMPCHVAKVPFFEVVSCVQIHGQMRCLPCCRRRGLRTGQKQPEGRNVRHAGEQAITMESSEDAYPLVSHTQQRTSNTCFFAKIICLHTPARNFRGQRLEPDSLIALYSSGMLQASLG